MVKICHPIRIDPRFRVGYITTLIEDGERLDMILVKGEMVKKVGVYEGPLVMNLETSTQKIDKTECISLEELEDEPPKMVGLGQEFSTIQEAIDAIGRETPSRKYKVRILPSGPLRAKKRRFAK